MNIVIDTNIWISFLIGKVLKKLKELIFEEKVTILTSHEQIEELITVLKRRKFKKYFSNNDIEEILYLVYKICQVVEIKEKVSVCRDKKDNFILDIAINGGADYIITGDYDLLALNPYRGIKIISFSEFEKINLSFNLQPNKLYQRD